MFELPELHRAVDEPPRVGVIGAGQFATKCMNQLSRLPALTLAAIADPDPDRIEDACAEADLAPERIDTFDDGVELATSDLDVILEATGETVAGARHAYTAISSGTHVVIATCEADAVVGPLLSEMARARGVVYTPAYGDQPALTAELVAWARACGFDVVAAGRGIGSYDANAAIELCVASNVTGLPPDEDGLHASTVAFSDISNRLRPRTDGGFLERSGVIEGVVSPPDEERIPGESNADGVFVVVHTANEATREFVQRKNRAGAFVSDDGKYVTFFRPHHLPGPETPVSIARAAFQGSHTGIATDHVADVVAVATEPLDRGSALAIHRTQSDERIAAELVDARQSMDTAAVPYGLLDGAELRTAVDAGTLLTYNHIELEDTFLRHLRGVQDATMRG